MVEGFPAPPAFWVGLRLYILMAPLTMLAPPIYLMSCFTGPSFYFALSLVAFLSISGYRLAQSDAGKAKVPPAMPRHAARTATPPANRSAWQTLRQLSAAALLDHSASPCSPSTPAPTGQDRANSSYTMAPNPIQKLFLMVFLPFWAAATFAGLFCAATVPRPLVSIGLFLAFLFFKNGICMSVILHR
jgi:hypothetical protein